MTIVCCWFDQSYARPRITAIADSRAARRVSGQWEPLSDTTMKLFKVPVRCHRLRDFDPDVAGWRTPYYETEIGVGFAGYCFEAMTIIALFSRAMEQLVMVTDSDATPVPDPSGIAGLIGQIVSRYFASHSNAETHWVELLVFGFAKGKPWISILRYNPQDHLATTTRNPMELHQIYSIGDVENRHRRRLDEIIKRIKKHGDRLKKGKGHDAAFDHAREGARHKDAQKKFVEEVTIQQLEDEYSHTVGGSLQKVEVYWVGDHAVASLARESRPDILDGLPMVAAELGYMPIGEPMGMRNRK
jgi:hypothetical protein